MKSHLSSLICHSLFFLFCLHTSNAQTVSTEDLKSVQKIIEEQNLQYFAAIEKNDVRAFEKQFTEDSWIMEPQAPIYCGPGATVDYFKEVMKKKGITKGKFIMIDLFGAGSDVVAEVGFYHFYNPSGTKFDEGTYIVLWKKVDGQWKRLRQTITSSLDN